MDHILKAVVLAPIPRLIDNKPRISVVVEIRDTGSPLDGSQVLHNMTPDMARRRAAELLAAADEAEHLQG